jgi:hypothetical protein
MGALVESVTSIWMGKIPFLKASLKASCRDLAYSSPWQEDAVRWRAICNNRDGLCFSGNTPISGGVKEIGFFLAIKAVRR